MNEEKTFTCAKCGKLKKASEGGFTKGEKAFCCEKCCGRPDKKGTAPNVCEFC